MDLPCDSNPLFQCRKIPSIFFSFTENNAFQIEATGKLRISGFSLSFRFWRYQFWWSIYSHNLMILWSILLRMIMLWCGVMWWNPFFSSLQQKVSHLLLFSSFWVYILEIKIVGYAFALRCRYCFTVSFSLCVCLLCDCK